MKFLILALFVAAANAGAIWPYAAPIAHGPIAQLSSAPLHHHVIAAPAISYAAHVAAPAIAYSHAHVAAPAIAYSHAPLAYAHAPVIAPLAHVPAHAATYKAQTLGATHIAPLPGHTIDRANLNLAAPPTH